MQLRFFILKFPLVFAMHPDRVRGSVERLRALCNTRDEWARDLHEISPSLLAYFLRDAKDLLMRLEYLAATGGCVLLWHGVAPYAVSAVCCACWRCADATRGCACTHPTHPTTNQASAPSGSCAR
jgi:hypothetical protein